MAFLKAGLLIRKIKPDLIFGTGGSVTFPVLTAGFLMRKKTAIWEGNSSLGLANKVLALFVSHVFTVFPKVKGLSYKKQICSAYPLRKQVQQAQKQKDRDPSDRPAGSFPFSAGDSRFQRKDRQGENTKPSGAPQKNQFKVLVLGGSQGSVFLNQTVSQALESVDWRKDIFIYHQTGEKSFNELSQKYKSIAGVSAFAFSKDIQTYYQECDLIFSRAGSGSLAEIALFGKAVVLIPLTYSAGGHQLKNAGWLFSKNCVQMIQEKDFTALSFKNKILELKQSSFQRKQMAQNLKKAYQREDKISPWLLKQLEK